MVRDVTDEQRSRQPIFIATLWAAASWLFFPVARSSRINLGMLVATASPSRTALKNSQLTRPRPDKRHAYFGNRTQEAGCLRWVRFRDIVPKGNLHTNFCVQIGG